MTRRALAAISTALAASLFACGPAVHTRDVGRVTGGPLELGSAGERLAREPLGETQLVARPSSSNVVTIRIVFDAGSAEDTPGREGVTRLTAKLMAEGGTADLTYAELTERLFPMAGEIDVSVDREQTTFIGRVARDELEPFYAIFHDVLARPRMAAEDFERLRAQARSSLTLELRGNDDEELGKETLEAMLFEGHPYGHPELGTESGLVALRVDDLRAHRTRVFCGARATVGVTGGFPAGFDERLREDVAALAFPTCVGRRVLDPPHVETSPRIWLVDKPDASSVAISIGAHVDVTRDDPDYPALVIAAAYLGQHRQFVGQLMQKMRGDRGLNYGDYAYAEHFVQDGWSRFPEPNIARRAQDFSIWIRPVEPEKAHFALRMAVRELREFVERGISEADFERVRTFANGYYALYLQTESRRLGFAIDDVFYGSSASYLERLRGAWQSLDAAGVNAAIRRHIDPSAIEIAVVTPDAAGFRDRIVAETPSPIEYNTPPSEAIQAEDSEIVSYRLGIPAERITIVPVAEMFR